MACSPAEAAYLSNLRIILLTHISWFLPLLGTVSNAMTILVMGKDFMSYLTHPKTAPLGSRVPFVLVWLAISDLLALYSKYFLDAAHYWFGSDLRAMNELCCKVCDPFYYSVGDVAIWIVVFLTFERFCLLWMPIKARSMFTFRATIITYLVLVVLICIKNFVWIFAHGLQESPSKSNDNVTIVKCSVLPNVPFWTDLYTKGGKKAFEMVVMSWTPIGLVFSFNLLIIYKWRKQIDAVQSLQSTSSGNDSMMRKEMKQLPIIVATSTAYLAFLLPFFTFIACVDLLPKDGCKKISNNVILEYLYAFMYLNHASNFFFYIASSRSYRNKLLVRFRQLLHRKQNSVTPLDSSTL